MYAAFIHIIFENRVDKQFRKKSKQCRQTV